MPTVPRSRSLLSALAAACLCGALGSPAAPAAEPAAEVPAEAAAGDAAAAASFAARRDAAVQGSLARLGLAPRIEPVTAQDTAFLTLLTPPRAPREPIGAVLVVPAIAAAISDPLIRALAHEPPLGGWLTLAMQPPDARTAAKEEFCARLAASLDHLKSRGNLPVVIAGIGGGFDATLACQDGKLPPDVLALAGIGRWHADLAELELPVLDLFPAADIEARRAADTRALKAESRNPGTYLQIAVDASDERFIGGEQEVARRLRGWLVHLPLPTRTASK